MRAFILSLFLVSVSAASGQSLLVGQDGLRHQIHKYLLDNDKDAATLYQNRDVVIRKVDGGEALVQWSVPGVAVPSASDLDTIANSTAIVTAPSASIKRVSGKWQLKTQTELDAEYAASPAGVLKGKRAVVRASLTNELRTAGFTNAVFTTDDVYKWLDTAAINAAAEKKILRWLSQYETLYRSPVRIDSE